MSAAIAAAAAAAQCYRPSSKRSSSTSSSMNNTYGGRTTNQQYMFATTQPTTSRYESQKQRDWTTFCQYRKNHKPVPLTLSKCGVEHVLDFIRYLDLFGETRQGWGSLDAIIGRLRVAFEENGGRAETNPFRLYLRQVEDSRAKAR